MAGLDARCILSSGANDAQGKGRICELDEKVWGEIGDRRHLGLHRNHMDDVEIGVECAHALIP